MGGGQGEAREEQLFGLEQLNGGKGVNVVVFIIFLLSHGDDRRLSLAGVMFGPGGVGFCVV